MGNEREKYIKSLIKQQGLTIKDFSQKLGVPYSTILSMLNGSIGGTSIDTIGKICRQLGISINDLQKFDSNEPSKIILTDTEKKLIKQYRNHLQFHDAIHKLLDV